jgi:hypothetical protein
MKRDPSIWIYGRSMEKYYKTKDFDSSKLVSQGDEGHLDC